MRKLYFLLFAFFVGFAASAQVNTYVFSQSTGAFTSINGTVLETATGLSGAASLDSRTYTLANGTIPFGFTFNGTAYTGLVVSSNGFITFGGTAPSTTLTTPISSTTAYNGAVAAVARDLNALFNIDGYTGDIRYETVGSAPNREFVIQWTNFRPFSSSAVNTTYWRWNFQIRLRESDNSIAVVYDFSFVGTPTASTAQVGLRGAANTDFSNRTSTTTWTGTAAGGTNAATVSYSTTNLPPSGHTFIWTPSSCFAPTALMTTNVTINSVDVSWTPPSSGTPTGYEYAVTTSAAPPALGTATTSTSATVSSLSPGTVYYLHVRTVCGGAFSNWATSTLFSTPSANDECNVAVSLTVNSGTTCTSVTQGSTVGATQTTTGCTGNADDDVWFSFTATNVAHTIALQNIAAVIGTSTDMVLEVFSGACGSLTSIKCSDPNTATVTSLSVGAIYYVRVYSFASTSRQNFELCVTTPPAAPANDECSGAIPIGTEPAGTTCSGSTSASTTNALPSLPDPSCTSTSNNDDIWFSFTADVSAYQLRFSNLVATSGTATSLGFAIYGGSCGSLNQLYCQATVTGTAGAGFSTAFGGLVPGNTYYLKVWTAGTTNSGTFDFCLQEAPTPPANDDCINAINVTPQAAGATCASSTSAVTTNATQSAETASCTTTAINDDIWYTFTAATETYQVRFSNMVQTSGTAATLGLAVYSGTCGSLTQLNCQSGFGTGGSGISASFGGLTIGNTYYLRLFTGAASNSATFDFCIQEAPTPPANDECAGAISVTPQALSGTCSTVTNATTVNSTQGIEATSCGSTAVNDDIWYTFTAGANGVLLRFSNMTAVTGTATALGYTVYSGTCGTLTEVACDATFGTSGSGIQIISGLTAGTTYYLRLFTASASNTATFDFCIQNAPQPANDECGGATNMPLTSSGSTCTYTAVNTVNSNQSTTTGQTNTCTTTGIDDDVWYTFTTGIAGDYNFSYTDLTAIIGTASTVGMNVYTGTCGALIEVTNACSSGFGSGGSGSRLVTLAASTTYTLRLSVGSSTNSGLFNFCITAPAPPPANDDCSGAINVTTQPSGLACAGSTAAVTTGATASAVTETSCTTTNDNDDIWYTFTATATSQALRFSNMVPTGGTATALGFHVFSGTCGSLTQLPSCDNTFGASGSGVATITGLTVGNVYYLRLYTAGTGNNATFDFCLQDPPSNDEATGAITLTVGAGCTGAPYTLAGTTQSAGEPIAFCADPAGFATAWFKFVSPVNGAVRISTDLGTGNTLTDSRVALFSTTDPGNYATFNIISCDDDAGSTSVNMSVVYATDLTAGTTYYVGVDLSNSTSTPGNFCIAVDALTASMLSTTNTCASTTQTPFGSNATYNGWVPLVDASSNLIALVKNPAGGEVNDYTTDQNVHTGAVRQTGGVFYLDRNYLINNTTATNVDVQFFFLDAELADLTAADGTTLNTLGVTRQTGTTCRDNFAAANGDESFLTQTGRGSSSGVSWITVTTPAFSNFYLNRVGAILPANLLTFSGHRAGNANQLKWTVAQETDVQSYEVERSENGRTWSKAGSVNSLGNTASQRSYSFADNNISGIKQMYRLRQVDRNGIEKLSNTIVITGVKANVLTLNGLFPNPALTKLSLLVDAPARDNVTIIVIDAVGRVVKTQKTSVEAGSNTLPLNVTGLSQGSYVVRITGETSTETSVSKFVKE